MSDTKKMLKKNIYFFISLVYVHPKKSGPRKVADGLVK